MMISGLKLILVGVAALLLAALALIGTAFLTSRAPILIGVAILTLLLSTAAGLSLIGGRRLIPVTFLVLLAVFSIAFLAPARARSMPGLPGVRYWDLPSGSRIAYLKLEPAQPARAEPIVYLHGGPGVGDLQGAAEFFGQLREDGYTVYVYDQLGAGRSSRLQDPSGYRIERDAADLEQIREQIGADRVILIGHSYGAGVASMYISRHGGRVAKLIVISPGALVGGVAGGGDLQTRLSTPQKLRLYSLLLQPRSLAAYILLQVNPPAAHAFAGDAEMDARNDAVYAVTEPALHCPGRAAPRPLHGVGFYANQFPQSARASQPQDFTPLLERYAIPTLIVKGSCDYLSWASAVEYYRAFQAGPSRIAYLSGAGHNVYDDMPQELLANMRAFLHDRPLPDLYTGTQVPPDFEKGY